jgi:hypothetical protein
LRAFANSTDNIIANEIVGHANELVLTALGKQPKNRYAYVIDLSSLPMIATVGLLNYWAAIFAHACPLGPRMVGALLLAAPVPVWNNAKEDIVHLFLKLRRK